jgi:hypothetical protein
MARPKGGGPAAIFYGPGEEGEDGAWLDGIGWRQTRNEKGKTLGSPWIPLPVRAWLLGTSRVSLHELVKSRQRPPLICPSGGSPLPYLSAGWRAWVAGCTTVSDTQFVSNCVRPRKFTMRRFLKSSMAIWQGVVMDSVKYHSGPPCPTMRANPKTALWRFQTGPAHRAGSL